MLTRAFYGYAIADKERGPVEKRYYGEAYGAIGISEFDQHGYAIIRQLNWKALHRLVCKHIEQHLNLTTQFPAWLSQIISRRPSVLEVIPEDEIVGPAQIP